MGLTGPSRTGADRGTAARLGWWASAVTALPAPLVRQIRRCPGYSFEGLTASAERLAGVARHAGTEHRDDEFLAGMRCLYESYQQVEDLSVIGATGVRQEVQRYLVNRHLMARYLAARPEITGVPVTRPIFVVGLPRSGTTLLHGLLGSAAGHRAPLLWELLVPPPPGSTPARQIRRAERLARLADSAAPAMRDIHPLKARGPEECVFVLPHSLSHYTRARIPAYRQWYASHDATSDYTVLKQHLQLLQWRSPPCRWILKSPFHLWNTQALLRVFPDATLVWPWRDPAVALASWCGLAELIMRLHSRRVDLALLGQDWSQIWAEAVTRAARVRAQTPESFVDVSYQDLAADPVATAERLLARLGTAMTPEARNEMTARLAAPRRASAHRYSLARYGLTPQGIQAAFGPAPGLTGGGACRL